MAGDFENLPVWTIPPDWSNGITERLEWLTDVLRSATAAEQRRMLRLSPRRTFELPFVLSGPEQTLFDLSTKAAGASDWYIPIWPDILRTTVALAGGSSTDIAVSTTYREYVPGGLLILYTDMFNYEVCVIDDVTSDNISLTIEVNGDWPAGTRVMPLMRAKFNQEPSGTKYTSRVATSTVSFTGTGANDWDSDITDLPVYGGFPVILTPPDYANNLSATFQRLTTLLDNSTGVSSLTDTAGFGFAVNQYAWYMEGLKEHYDMRRMLYGLAGRLTPVWIPTFSQDFDLVKPIRHDNTSFTVKRCGYTDFGGATMAGRTDLAFFMRDGSVALAAVADAAIGDDPTTEVISLTAPVGFDIDKTNLIRISFLALSRQDSDTVEITHGTDYLGVGTATTIFRDAPDLRALNWDAFDPTVSYGGVLSNFNQTITFPGGNPVPPPNSAGALFARTKHGYNAGKFYFEGTFNKSIGFMFGAGFGICTATATHKDISQTDALNAAMLFQYGAGRQIIINGTIEYQNALPDLPVHMCFAVNLDDKLFFARGNPGEAWNYNGSADPVTGEGGFDLSVFGDDLLYPCCTNEAGNGSNFTVNLGSSVFSGVVPHGYRNGWPAFV